VTIHVRRANGAANGSGNNSITGDGALNDNQKAKTVGDGALCGASDEGGDAMGGALKQRILQIVVDNPGINRSGLVQRTGASARTIDRVIGALSADQRIERRGSKKTGGYFTVGNQFPG
jgi:hypothetical protein